MVFKMEKDYKPITNLEKEIEDTAKKVAKEFKRNEMLIAVLLYKLVEERENTNRMLKTLINKIEKLEARIGKEKKEEEIILPEIDEKIVEIVKRLGKATAKEVAKLLGYKGSNGASARLNKLYSLGILKKKRVGRKIIFMAR